MTTKPAPLLSLSLYAADESVTQQVAEWLSPLVCSANDNGGHIHLIGDLGAGKTSFTRAFLRHEGVTGRIKSPSYGLVESYNLSSLKAYHLDFYRFSDSREWLDAGFRDMLEENAVVLIEWPDQAGALLPTPDLTITFDYCEPGRQINLSAYSKKGQSWLELIKTKIQNLPPRA
ncbi:tRNA (adenosine(37)-N6)-threonylcarbamoyltransferase complex ATPase subunit type 1 TsaE [Alcaligenaceae bacterium 429]|uniref:tRNA (adenosine(37)-N6)-threonylcarbamoyltransferase complex ATPase subunit type 1 TsaE n=1 Tax=Paenalcaligenes sp. Me52 TaxID=3392038 RepID=UPI0010922134|nr:tRNA (adenosine(37)-N6)-threonylcarbamoyltransferase complex ATPase subunit type 1 TsaE [Alcaligenaceae bacterium 429]